MNITSFVGHLGADPDLRYTGTGKPVASMRVAIEDRYQPEQPTWVTVISWGPLATAVAEHKTKGDQVAVTGRLRSREFDTKDGQHRQVLEVVAAQVDFLNRKRTDEPTSATADNDTAETEEEPF